VVIELRGVYEVQSRYGFWRKKADDKAEHSAIGSLVSGFWAFAESNMCAFSPLTHTDQKSHSHLPSHIPAPFLKSSYAISSKKKKKDFD